jgi:nuclear transport factor 2 (NTF2) superfamily protein
MENKQLIPPFSAETATEKLRLNETLWNSRDPEQVSLLYTIDIEWMDRTELVRGRAAVKAYLTRKWEKERIYKIKKELWGAKENRNAVRFEEEWRDENGQWYHSYGNELLEFDEQGLIRKRFASISDLAIGEGERKLV